MGWLGTIRNECLDHMLIMSHQHLQRSVNEYTAYLLTDASKQDKVCLPPEGNRVDEMRWFA